MIALNLDIIVVIFEFTSNFPEFPPPGGFKSEFFYSLFIMTDWMSYWMAGF